MSLPLPQRRRRQTIDSTEIQCAMEIEDKSSRASSKASSTGFAPITSPQEDFAVNKDMSDEEMKAALRTFCKVITEKIMYALQDFAVIFVVFYALELT